MGRSITLVRPPQRVVSLAPSNTERLFALGAGDAVVGVTLYDTYPPEVHSRATVGGFAAASLSIEKIASLRPDVVLAAGEIQRPVITSLEQLGIVVVAIEDPRDFTEVYAALLLVGQVMGREAAAQQVVEAMQERVARVQKVITTIPPQQRLQIFYEVFDAPLMTAGPATFIGQMLEMAGGINIFPEVGGRYVQISAEEVVRRNPACILGLRSHRLAFTPADIARRPGWAQITAVQQQCIHLFDDDTVSRPGPRVAEALERIARTLYPQFFP